MRETESLHCDSDRIRLGEHILAARQGSTVEPLHPHELYRTLAPSFGASLDWTKLNGVLGRGARFLTAGQVADAQRCLDGLAKFNPNHFGSGPQHGEFAPRDYSDDGVSPIPARADSKRLSYEEIRDLVHRNNRSKHFSDELVTALIYKESSFDPVATNCDPHGNCAVGLMQIREKAMKDVVADQKLKTEPVLLEPAQNIRTGTAYLDILWKRYNGDADAALDAFRGHREPAYPSILFAAEAALKARPADPMAELRRTVGR